MKRKCLQCDGEFERGGRADYCSRACRNEANSARKQRWRELVVQVRSDIEADPFTFYDWIQGHRGTDRLAEFASIDDLIEDFDAHVMVTRDDVNAGVGPRPLTEQRDAPYLDGKSLREADRERLFGPSLSRIDNDKSAEELFHSAHMRVGSHETCILCKSESQRGKGFHVLDRHGKVITPLLYEPEYEDDQDTPSSEQG